MKTKYNIRDKVFALNTLYEYFDFVIPVMFSNKSRKDIINNLK